MNSERFSGAFETDPTFGDKIPPVLDPPVATPGYGSVTGFPSPG